MDQPIVSTQASPVVELRQYTLHPGKRDTLIDLFETHFVAGQEATGSRLHGEFRDARDPDRFVWLRGFRDMRDRERALRTFYEGPTWKAHSKAANATMVDVSNVLLLEPVDRPGFSLAGRMASLMIGTIWRLKAPADAAFVRFFGEQVKPALAEAGAPPVAALRTLRVANNFPALPVREGENVFAWFAAFATRAEYERYLARLGASRKWPEVEKELARHLESQPVRLELETTPESLARNAQRFEYSLDRTGDVRDFDFIEGTWKLENHRLLERGAGSAEMDHFPARCRGYVLMGGVTNVDEVVFPTKGWWGTTFRHFDLEKRQWSIYWVNNRDGKMQAPVVGGFEGDIGLFYGEDLDEGRPVKVVYKWTKVGPNAARWEQAFSYDGGVTWETNWTNELSREN
jgi:hypothetical protein